MAGPVRIAILANGSQARREFQQTSNSLTKLSGAAKGVGFGLLAAGAVGFAKSAVDVERKFSTTMRTLQASTDASALQMKRLNEAAVKLGADTAFSAGQAADAMLELGKSGFKTADILKSVPQVMNLAATEGIELSQAAGLVTSSLAQFGLKAADSAQVVNALAGAATASRSSVAGLGESMKLVGSAGRSVGLSVQETAAALAALSQAGLDGSVAGTSLAAVFNHLVPQTKAAADSMKALKLDFTDAQGNFDDVATIAGKLSRAFGGMSQESRKIEIGKIFGRDASTIAAVNALIASGAKGLRGFTAAASDTAAAQKLATARMSGTEGALERLSGAVETAKLRLGQELAPAIVAGADALDDKLVPALESGIDAGKKIGKALAPAVSEIVEALENLAGEGNAVGSMFNDVFLPALTATSEVVGGLVDFFDDLPGPVKEVGVQAGIAALVFPRLTAGVTGATAAVTLQIARLQQLRAEMTYTATRAQLTTAAMAKFGAAAKATAGIGGMVLLTQGMQQTDGAAKALLTTLGGAATGFAFAGPAGAVVGGLGGLMLGLADGTNRAETAARVSTTTWETYATTLDSVTGATTRATKSMIIQDLQKDGLLGKIRALGVSQATVVNGVLGQAKASEILNEAIKNEEASIRDAAAAYNEKYTTSIARNTDEAKAAYNLIQSRRSNVNAIKAEVGEVKKSTQAKREELLLLQNFPDNVITRIQTPGAVDSKRELAELVATYSLTPKQIATVIKMNGIKASKDDVQSLAREIVKSGNVKPGNAWRNFFEADLVKAKGTAQKGTNDLNSLLSAAGDVTPKIRHGAFGRGLSGDLSQLKALASSGGSGVGTNLGSGMYFGLGQWINPISQRAAAMVRGAVSAANAAGAIQSPSRETMRTGDMLGLGLVRGLERSRPAARTAGQLLMAAVLGGVDDGRSGVDAALAKVTAQIRKSITGKNQTRRENALLKNLADEYKALRLNGTAQDRINDKLEIQRDRLKDLRQEYADYAKSIKDAFTATGDITQLGKQDDGSVSIRSLLNELQNRVIGAERFAFLTEQLAKQGLSQASVQQLLSAGPEAALATAEAIASGGSAAIAEMNELQTRLARSGDQLGNQMATRYYGAGVDAAAGIVRGLEAQAATLDAAAVRLANNLVAAVKRALGIRSPSKEFREIANHVTDGLTLQLDENSTYVKRTGAGMASSLVKGFGTPALAAYASSQSAAGGGTVRVRFSAQQVSQLQRGREIQADLDFARGVGVLGESF